MQFILSLNNGCGDSSVVTISIHQDSTIYIPNAFSPNGDGINDIFTVYRTQKVQKIKQLIVFDRWGELIYQGADLQVDIEGWNGYFRGKKMNPAVFVYYAEIELLDGTLITKKGDITLIR